MGITCQKSADSVRNYKQKKMKCKKSKMPRNNSAKTLLLRNNTPQLIRRSSKKSTRSSDGFGGQLHLFVSKNSEDKFTLAHEN